MPATLATDSTADVPTAALDRAEDGALVETLATDDAGSAADCACACAGADCTLPADCPAWPPVAVEATVAGVSYDAACACDLGTDAFIPCVNTTLTMRLTYAVSCVWLFEGRCERSVAAGDRTFAVRVSYLATVTSYPDGSVTVGATLAVAVIYGDGTFSGSAECKAAGDYFKTYAPGTFPCGGPWTLDFLSATGCGVGWPATVTLTSGGGGPAAPGNPTVVSTCCADTPLPPVDPPPNPCDSPPCGDGDDGGLPGGPVAGLGPNCCDRGEAVAATLHVAIAATGGSACLAAAWGISWSNSFKAWVGSTVACGAFVTVAVWCDGDTWEVRLWLNGALAFSQTGDYATDTGSCSPLSLTWSFDLAGVPAAAGIATGAFQVHVFEDPDE